MRTYFKKCWRFILTKFLLVAGLLTDYMRFSFIIKCIILLFMLLLTTVITYNITFDINDEGCGLEASQNLIHRSPWQAILEYYRRGHKTEHRCGATLISSRFIITAGHCVKEYKFSRLTVRLGEYDTSKERDCLDDVCSDSPIIINVAEIVAHPDYYDKHNDIAILRLEDDAPYTDFIRPVCLPSGDLDPNITYLATGFGKVLNENHFSKTKKFILLPSWDIKDCQRAYNTYTLPNNIICAGGEKGVDTCYGDSGGPLTALIKKRIELLGVTSFGNTECGTEGSPAVYTKVIDYLGWIRSIVTRKYGDS